MLTWLSGESFIEWMEQHRGTAAQSTEVLGCAQNEPVAQHSCVQRTLEVLNLFSAEAQSWSVCSPVLVYDPPPKP